MKKYRLFFGLALLWGTVVLAKTHTFHLPDGREVEAEIAGYNARTGLVELQRTNGKHVKVKPSVFIREDQTYIQEWITLNEFMDKRRLKIGCAKKKIEQWKKEGEIEQRKFERFCYDVAFENNTSNTLEKITVDYCIYYEKERNNSGTKKVDTIDRTKKGTYTVEVLQPGKNRSFSTDDVVLERYEFNTSDFYMPDGDYSTTQDKIKGIWIKAALKTSSGQTAVREVYEPLSIKKKYHERQAVYR